MSKLDLGALKAHAKPANRYQRQINRLESAGIGTQAIQAAVDGTIVNLNNGANSLVIYGDPQSGKTEMMICLTAKLLDEGRSTIVHLMNDSVDLHSQNLSRFKTSGIAPAPMTFSELSDQTAKQGELVVFCKKNARDLEKLIDRLDGRQSIVVVDDEADYATPNSKVNSQTKTAINGLVGQLIGPSGTYLGVTATPARLDLNSTFDNDSAKWVKFPAHPAYTGQDTFFPLDAPPVPYRLRLLNGGGTDETRKALLRFLVTVAHLNRNSGAAEKNYTMLVHTSGKRNDHEADRLAIQTTISAINDVDDPSFIALAQEIFDTAEQLYKLDDPQLLTNYVVENISRTNLIVLNSKRDRKAAGENPTEPTSPFTIIVGGNIVSRGVTFPNLLSMYFTRDVSGRIQQDTYIQRARMFGARGSYLADFELTIPAQLYWDWHRCFAFHRLALASIGSQLGSPVWIGDRRISVASDASIHKAAVSLNKGEMSFGAFEFSNDTDELIRTSPSDLDTLAKLRDLIGDSGLPPFLVEYLKVRAKSGGSLALHTSSSIAGLSGADQDTISRTQGFIGTPQLQLGKFPNAAHHIKIFRNAAGLAKLFYKFRGNIQFVSKNKPA